MIRTDDDGKDPTGPSTGGKVLIEEPHRLTDAVPGNFGPALRQLSEDTRSRCRSERDRLEEGHHRLLAELADLDDRSESARARLRALRGPAASERAAGRRPAGSSLFDRIISRGDAERVQPASGAQAALEQARTDLLDLQVAASLKRAEIHAYPERAATELESHKDALREAFEREGNAMLDRRSAAHGGQLLDSWLEEWASHPRPDLDDVVLRLSTGIDTSAIP